MSTGTVILLVVVVGMLASMFMRRGSAGGHGMGGCGMGHGGHDHSHRDGRSDGRDEATPTLGEAGQPAPAPAHDRHANERHRHC
jgi:hypothetical protein